MAYMIEIATSDYSTTLAAVQGGADRIELCANLAEGGTTASLGTIRKCREDFDVLLYPIIRPRGGDFLYTDEEMSIMLQDIKLCRELGCDGVVIGILQTNGEPDLPRTARLIEAAYPLGVTFHRAFDRCLDPFQAMEQLISIGCERILTSGQQPAAPDGIPLIRELNRLAAGRITIMPGSGVKVENVRMIADETGCRELHSSLRRKVASGMQFIHPNFAGSEESYSNNAIDSTEVARLKKALLGEQLPQNS